LLIEDADNAVMARSEGNEGMSYLLNLTDGIIPLKKKIVIVTNLPSINKVDPALIRPGRCYDILEFRSLTAEQAEAARASIDMPYLDLTAVKSKWSLAEALNYDLDLKLAERKKTSIGFTS
jgi:ATP-dependent 26S proteasome regulatory subunit